MNEIALRKEQLPDTIEELSKFVLIKTAELNARRILIKGIKELDKGNEAHKTILKETQLLGEDVLIACAKLGELTKLIPKSINQYAGNNVVTSKNNTLKSIGLTKMQANRFETLADNQDLINEVINEALEKDKIPTKDEVLKRAKKKKKEQKIEEQKQKITSGEISLPEGIFDIIVIDPPWPYGRKYDPETSRSANPYPEMSIQEISNIKLTPDKDCILWFWTTHRFIWDARIIMDKWGFEYKGILVWNKENMGMGSWLRMQCEFCLLGIKGKPLWDVKDLRDIMTYKGGEHSAKPDEFYTMINEKFISKAEFKADYFGRKERPGWKIKKNKR